MDGTLHRERPPLALLGLLHVLPLQVQARHLNLVALPIDALHHALLTRVPPTQDLHGVPAEDAPLPERLLHLLLVHPPLVLPQHVARDPAHETTPYSARRH
jgi:hypothetical protein